MTRKKDKQNVLREPPADYGKAVVIYESPEGVHVDVKLGRETVWLTQKQISELFATERSSIAKHLRNMFKTGELIQDSVCAKFAQTALIAEIPPQEKDLLTRVLINLISRREP